MSEVILNVGGMSCEGCSKRLQASLSAVDGVEHAHVTLAPGQAVVQFDSSRLTEKDIRENIEDSGFDVLTP